MTAAVRRMPVSFIHQDLGLIEWMTVTENICLTLGYPRRFGLIEWSQARELAERALARIGADIDPDLRIQDLTRTEKSLVAIARALATEAEILILDEPTASLPADEVMRLFGALRRLREHGVGMIYVSHRLDEVFEIADRVTVLRDGRRISSRPRDEVTPQRAIQEMVGREMSEFFARTEHPRGGLAIRVTGIGRTGAFADVSFEVHKGEVLGLAGLVGAGRTDVALALFGIAPAESGSVELDGRPVVIRSPREALRHGIAYLSEDRRQLGLSLPQSLTANVTLATLDRYMTRLRLLDSSAERAVADRFRRRHSIRTPSLETPVERLSGGNQQKTMLAKWLNAEPTVLILDEPTRGIDVGAKAEVHHIIDELARSGMAIILISSDLPEVLAMSDRILVMREGRQVGMFGRSEATEEGVITAAMGAA
jgi:rhamnose transport system ATP-binding protein